jgi:hypothetical protein
LKSLDLMQQRGAPSRRMFAHKMRTFGRNIYLDVHFPPFQLPLIQRDEHSFLQWFLYKHLASRLKHPILYAKQYLLILCHEINLELKWCKITIYQSFNVSSLLGFVHKAFSVAFPTVVFPLVCLCFEIRAHCLLYFTA